MVNNAGRHLVPGSLTRDKLMRRWNRSLVLVAVAFALMTTTVVGLASGERSIGLAEEDRGTESFSPEGGRNGCKWGASHDNVVWRLSVEVEGEDREDGVEIVDYAYQMAAEDAVVKAETDGRHLFIMTNRHTTLLDAKVSIRFEGDNDLRQASDLHAELRLTRVCYQGDGPVPEVTFVFQAQLCNAYSAIDGNQISGESAGWDQTEGAWQSWNTVYESNAPMVRQISRPSSGCDWHAGQGFSMGTSSSISNRYSVGQTNRNGFVTVRSRDLPWALKNALVTDGGQVWFSRTGMDGAALGAFKCHDDSLHADSKEFIHETPADHATVVCIANNVSR